LLSKYTPETKKDKIVRLKKEAETKAAQKKDSKSKDDGKVGPKPILLKFGLNHVTELVEQGKAKLVVIAHDVDPIEMMVFLPALCRKKNIAYCFVKGQGRLGKLVHQKTATCLAVTDVKKEDYQDLDTFQKTFKALFNDNEQLRRHWGGGIMGIKNQHMMAKREKQREIELAKKANM
jgi:large subunit ribosomal protein L7Ae